MTAVQQTSLRAFAKLPILTRQKQVYDALCHSGERDMTNTEIAALLGWPINCVTPRIYELRQKGLVAQSCERPCRKTGEICKAWVALEILEDENKGRKQ